MSSIKYLLNAGAALLIAVLACNASHIRSPFEPIPVERSIAYESDSMRTPTLSTQPATLPAMLASEAASSPAPVDPCLVTANTALNIRSGPSTEYSISGALIAGQPSGVIGRDQNRAWWQINEGGWVSAAFVTTSGDCGEIGLGSYYAVPAAPLPTAISVVQPTSPPPAYNFTLTNFTAEMHTLYQNGLSAGNLPNRFTLVGDSEMYRENYLLPFDKGNYNLGEYGGYQSVIDYYRGSFEHRGVSVNNGMMAREMFNPAWSKPEVCGVDETPIECEFRTYHPSLALILLRERLWFPDWRETYLRDVRAAVAVALKYNVIPILTTVSHVEGQAEFNERVRQVSAEAGVPVWDLARSTDMLPAYGIGQDLVHLSAPHELQIVLTPEHLNQYGLAVHNLQTLELLDYLKRELNH